MNNKVLKAGIWYVICNFLVRGLSFILMPIFTRIMSSSDIGSFSNITAWFNILAIVTTFEIYSSVSIARFDYKEELDSYISSTLCLGTIITACFYVIVLCFRSFFESLFNIDFITLNIIFIYLLFYPSIQMLQIKNQIDYNYKSTVFITLINSIPSSILSILLTLILNDALHGRIYGYYIPLIIVAILVYIYLFIKGKGISTKYWKYALAISFPLIWHLLAGNILTSSDRVMITKIISPEANALYSIPYTISMIVSILWTSMHNAWTPWAYEKMDKKDYLSLKKYSKLYLIFFLTIVFPLVLIAPEILRIMGGEYYMQAKYVMPPVILGYVFQFVYSLYVNIEFYHKKQKNIAIGTIIAAIINIVLNLIFIPKFGYIAAAYTTLIGYMSLFIIHYLFVSKLNCLSWYDSKFIFVLLGISIIFMIICNILYVYNIIRYVMILCAIIVVLAIMIKYRKEIFYILKNKSIDGILKKNI